MQYLNRNLRVVYFCVPCDEIVNFFSAQKRKMSLFVFSSLRQTTADESVIDLSAGEVARLLRETCARSCVA